MHDTAWHRLQAVTRPRTPVTYLRTTGYSVAAKAYYQLRFALPPGYAPTLMLRTSPCEPGLQERKHWAVTITYTPRTRTR